MATTDAKPGFRLPWSADRGDAATTAESATPAQLDATEGSVEPTPDHEVPTPAMIDAPAPEGTTPSAAAPPEPLAEAAEAFVEPAAEASLEAAAPAPAEPTPVVAAAPTPPRKPNKLMADLTRAMQAAAEVARTEALARLSADSKAFIETIHADSATEATELRRQADDDVAAIREWSKTEIARIREETEERISGRKGHLEREIDQHAAAIERRIERVQARVAAFEIEMAAFFERLTAEEDPTRLAAMAESLPEPPAFDAGMDEEDVPAPATSAVAEAAVEPVEVEAAAEPVSEAVESVAETVESVAETAEPAVERVEDEAAADDTVATAAWPVRPEAAWGAAPAPEPTVAGDLFSIGSDTPLAESGETDPRLAAFGLDADFAAAEAEAADFGNGEGLPEDDIPVIADDALAARLAGLVPEPETSGDTVTTRVVVVGLVSVASIAGFKRHLSRVPGVESVGVSSGPDGEFVFAVARGADLDLGTAITTLPGFAARVTGESDGELQVTARDPEHEG